MKTTRFEKSIVLIDKENSKDIHNDYFQGKAMPKELLYSKRMSKKLMKFKPNASEEIQIAAHAQHICRWKIPRDAYPMNRVGYLKWREKLKKMHADMTSNILKEVGYNSKFIERVSFLIQKKLIKKDEESQVIEDIICLVFLEYYFEEFATKHKDEKIIEILKKTWSKMSCKAQEWAIKLQYGPEVLPLIIKATT